MTDKVTSLATEFDKLMAAGERATQPETVEVPLSSEYLTPDGQYVAGYWWGSKGRGPEIVPEGATCEFIQGMNDGWGDWMESIRSIKPKPKSVPIQSFDPNKDDLLTYSDLITDLKTNGILETEEYQRLANEAIELQLDKIIKGMKTP